MQTQGIEGWLSESGWLYYTGEVPRDTRTGRVLERIRWYVRQVVPTPYRSRYGVNGKPHRASWWMWLGRSFAVREEAV